MASLHSFCWPFFVFPRIRTPEKDPQLFQFFFLLVSFLKLFIFMSLAFNYFSHYPIIVLIPFHRYLVFIFTCSDFHVLFVECQQHFKFAYHNLILLETAMFISIHLSPLVFCYFHNLHQFHYYNFLFFHFCF